MRDVSYFRQPGSLARHSAINGASKTPVLVLISVLCTLVMGGVVSAEEHSLIIDEMESTSIWSIFVEGRGSSADISTVPGKDGKALEISYNLKDDGWVSISRSIDPYTLLEIEGISFDYWGDGNPNTLEFKLVYEDGTNYGKQWHNATDVKDWKIVNVSLMSNELECWFPKENCEKYGELNLSRVRWMEFAVSDKGTDVGDSGGAGRIIIDNVRRKISPPPEAPITTTTTYTLSGGSSPFDPIVVDDDLEVKVNGKTVFLDDDTSRTEDSPLWKWKGDPITFEASPGDTLRIIATDWGVGGAELSGLYVHVGGKSFKLTDGTSRPSKEFLPDIFFDESYTLPDTSSSPTKASSEIPLPVMPQPPETSQSSVPAGAILLAVLAAITAGIFLKEIKKRKEIKKMEKPAETIREAVKEIGGVVSIDDVFNYYISRKCRKLRNRETISTNDMKRIVEYERNYGSFKREIIMNAMRDLAVNSPRSLRYKESEKFLFLVKRGKHRRDNLYRLYDPEKDGTWKDGRKVSEPEPISPGPPIPKELLEYYENPVYHSEGGTSLVYQARRKRDGMTIALKIAKNWDTDYSKSFIKEVTIWEGLKHPNIAKIYDYAASPRGYIEMEFVENSLEKLPKPVNPQKAAYLIFKIAEGLRYAHGRPKPVYHLDLKPANILLANDEELKIVDWGLAKVKSSTNLTKGLARGYTTLYATPEQISNKKVDARTDVFQVGQIFYELVIGKAPFEADCESAIMEKIKNEQPLWPSDINPDAELVKPIIMCCLEKEKEKRYQSAEELQRELANVLGMKLEQQAEITKHRMDRIMAYTKLIEICSRLDRKTECIKWLGSLKAVVNSTEVKALIEEEITRIELHIKEDVKIEERLPAIDEIIHRARMEG